MVQRHARIGTSAAASTSASVVVVPPAESRTAPKARFPSQPIAARTEDGTSFPAWQAAPVDAADDQPSAEPNDRMIVVGGHVMSEANENDRRR